jgi:hypothetical protein
MRIPIYYHHHHLIRVLLLETAVITGRRGIRSSFATTAFSFPFPTSNIRQHFLHHHRRADGGVVAMYHDDERSSIIDTNTNTTVMINADVIVNDDDHDNDNKKEKENNVPSIRKEKESLAFTKVLNPNDMIEYYNKTKKILQRDDDDDDDNDEEFINTMNNKFLELRHKKSMIRCVLNNYDPNSYSTNDGNDSNIDRKTKKEVLLITKVDLQQRLRLIERRNKWNITHRLLFGCDDNNDQNENDNNDQNGNENNASSSYWWTLKDGVIDNEKAPEFLIGIEEHYNYDNDNDNDNDNDDDDDDDGNITTAASTISTMKTETKTKRGRNKKQQSSYEYENNEDPKRFLSRLARGRTYKGNFRNLLQDIDDANDSSKENLLSLYDEITGVVDATDGGKKACCGCDKEVQLLHSFVDELEREQQQQEELTMTTMTTTTTTTSSVSESASDADAAVRRLIVNKEQIDLLRMICNLDDHNNNNNNNSNGSSSSSNTVDDGGRSWGKRGESNLNLYLEERHKQESTISSTTMVLSPVWVRGKKKNRQRNNCSNNDKSRNKKDSSNNKKNNFNNNIKQRCQYVLETTNTDVLLSSGTTSEFDAMVVRTTTYDNDNYDVQKEQEQEEQKPLVVLPMMIIEEVWDAKATLDPSALLDVLNKKVTSLQRILFHNYNNNDDGNDDDDGNSETNEEEERSAIIEAADAKFVIFPDNNNNNKKHPNTKTAATNMPIVFQVGIGSKDIDGDDDSNNNNDINGFDDNDDEIKIGSCCQQQNLLLLPQIGIFANRMFSPKSAARRIETIVYERLLETDVDTVKSIIMTRNNNSNNKYDVEGNDHDYNRRHHRHRRIIRDESVKIIDRIIRLIENIQPIVVIGDCNNSISQQQQQQQEQQR